MKQVVIICLLCTLFSVSCKSSFGDDEKYVYNEEEVWAAGPCKNASICTDEICLLYQQVWKELFIEGHGLSEDYFDNHIEICGTSMEIRCGTTEFIIHYKMKVDWAIMYDRDWMRVRIDSVSPYAPPLLVPPYTYLTKDEIKKIQIYKIWLIYFMIEEYGFKLPAYEKLKFDSYGSAMNYLAKKANVSRLKFNRITIDPHRNAWILYTITEYDQESHKCIWAELNLNTGETVIEKGSCLID